MNYFLITEALDDEYDIFVGRVLEMKIRWCSDWGGDGDSWAEYYVDLNGESAQLWEDVEGFFLADLKGDELEMYKMLYPLAEWSDDPKGGQVENNG